MTNTIKLKEKIAQEGYTIEKLSKELKIRKNTLIDKINNKLEFSQKNIIEIKELLKLTDQETIDIFLS